MYYYNQNDYSNVSYDNPNTSKKENVATSGCGVTSLTIIVNNLIGKEYITIQKMAQFSLTNGARDNSGTNMKKLLDAWCKKHKEFSYKTTNSETDLVAHLKKGGKAIANQGNNYNVFSTGGHYVVAYKMDGSNIQIVDPQMYSGKYDAYSRPKRIIKKTSTGCVVNKTELGKATADRNPAYYLITYTKPEPKAPTIKNGAYSLTNERGVYKGIGANSGRKKVKDLTDSGKASATSSKLTSDAYLKANTKVTIMQTKIASSGNLWAEIPSGWICIWEKDKTKLFIK